MYIPKPIDTSSITLSPEIMELCEQLAKNVHEVWSEGRIADGWSFGAVRDDAAKKHPCLIPYEELPEREKDFDRNTALQTLRLIVKLGYRIEKEDPQC
ncbi:MAG: Ryanodine receptor Ryr [Ruminococcaceae bacterium]|nr:Ryanodine receptor Ryr [Oscillospiraceae bacterium]